MKTCLIVDDSRVVRKVAARIVRDLKFDVLPVMNGLDFLRALRREEGGKHPLVVFCSIENDAEHINEALSSGADEFIMKPFDADILESKFAEVGLV